MQANKSMLLGDSVPLMIFYQEGKPDDMAIGSVVTGDLRARLDTVIVGGTGMEFLA